NAGWNFCCLFGFGYTSFDEDFCNDTDAVIREKSVIIQKLGIIQIKEELIQYLVQVLTFEIDHKALKVSFFSFSIHAPEFIKSHKLGKNGVTAKDTFPERVVFFVRERGEADDGIIHPGFVVINQSK